MTLRKTLLGHVAAALTATALLAGAAIAQSQTRFTEADDDTMEIMPLGMTVDRVEDMRLYLDDGTAAGEIETVLVDAAGTPVALVVEPESDLQVEGEDDLVITIDQVTAGDGRLTTGLTRDSLLRLPRRDD